MLGEALVRALPLCGGEGPTVSEGGRGGEWQKALAKWGQEWPVGGPTEGPVLSGQFVGGKEHPPL